ncbi:ABC transporter, ATP-binding protein [Dehalobacter sp. UNSWDHB]|uniref:ABC transporter ATP-binding protein n=1 Tax=unclassified Dehalobacter TaxID=2635733 RepID=UPI00028A7132|nr:MULTISPECIES: ABC transporter ATP-binding protein [unclassified Dehalobacter]AFV03455.1 ABC transporter, ATP-binding protein [Dehalobacter sp. DCA]AFV06442.1 ABC transporter related protein [Dehalobacter sp. CF]EQB20014.1 ABC transporter, ATP-binding protein [Dehalobacter sp. UNSWDHB]
MIEVKNLTKNFGKNKVLNELNINVRKASVYGLLGPNGAGKTTLIKHLTGLYRQDQGTVAIDHQPVYENPEVKARMVYIPDDLYFFSQYSIDETAKFYAKIYPQWNWNRYEQLKQVFPIDSKRRVVKLSKGMQKQVAFWLGICAMPSVMVLDEPVDGLDPVMRKKVWSLVLQDVAEREVTVLVSSHNLRELEDVCDHVGILHNGKIVVERELDDMKSDIHKFQIAFSDSIPEGFLVDTHILHKTQTGSILLLIARGDKDELMQKVKSANPVILDVLPLTLEEIFIYELGGMGYDIQNILI